ncbi:MAG TPA: efflux RND transporter periplasmic adaptor subunit [Gemmatimonadaceae bacterium]|nr:efflux RND transporter periplasmic adaptor subunit [Gemmatimonadaceae bacterium]
MIGLAVAAAACNRGESQTPQGRGPGGPRGDRVIPVEVAVAALGTAARSVSATGNVEPLRTIGVNSQLSGAVQLVGAREGDYVAEGAVLARIDAPEIAAQLTSAEAALEVAESTAQRSEQLWRQRIITAMEYERDQAALAAARATRDQLRTRLDYATVRAPVSGVILERRVEAGDITSPQQRLFTIGDVSTLIVRVPVSELDVTALREGDMVDVSLDALEGRSFQGRIRRIFPAADSITRLVPVEVELGGPAARQARPGFLARVTFRLDPRTGVLLVPSAAVLENTRGPVVYVVRDGRAALRPVRRGSTYEGQVEITTGLTVGDSVVVAGNTNLRDGAQVRVVDARSSVRPPADAPLRDTIGAAVSAAVGVK